ncbi:MAG: hypothetical protein R3290_05480 [Acidimicrobiia bacterium]|nr:hypothetical protein [Acidimicrobiia bacterium]
MYHDQGRLAMLGPVIRTLGLALVAFAILWAVSPHLQAGRSSDGVPTAVSGGAVSGTVSSDPIPTAPVTTMPTEPAVTRVAEGTADQRDSARWEARNEELVADAGWPADLRPSGDLSFSVQPATASPTDRTWVAFTIEVTNRSDRKLWGLFVYQELAGPAACGDSVLEPGESTTCTVEDYVYEGEQTADVWATAWDILDEMSADRILQPYTVGPYRVGG